MNFDIEYKLFLSALIVFCVMCTHIDIDYFTNFAIADDINPGLYSKDSMPFGKPYEEWIVNWTKWFISIPAEVHPRDHYTPERCAIDQSGPVWFLTDILIGEEKRTCIIPSGKAILLPTLSGSCWDDDTDPGLKTEEGLTQCAMAGNEFGLISATLDGRELQNLENYRIQTPFYNITVPENNVFNNVPGVWKAKSDGYYLFLEPLAPGNHTLHTVVSVTNPISPSYNYASDLTYNLIVQP